MSKYELVVLGFLSDGPTHGYQVNRQVKAHRMTSWANIATPMVYKTLTNLEKSGMVGKVRVERDGLMPERRIYQLTGKGKKRLATLVEKSFTDKNLSVDISALGYFFVHALSKTKALECLGKRKSLLEEVIQDLQDRRGALKAKAPLTRIFSIERDLDRFKSEMARLEKIIEKTA